MPALTFEQILTKSETPTGCGVIVVRDGKILAGTRIERAGKGRLCGPGGHIEAGESPEEAAKRETWEEFGIVCNDLVPLGTLTMGGRYGNSAVFLCSNFTGQPKTDEKEMTDPEWIRASEITEEEAYPPFFQSLQLLQDAKPVAKNLEEILKFNENHDRLGRFSSAAGAGGAGGTSRKITEHSTGSYDDQVDMRMESHDGDSLAGYLEYSVYNGTPSIQYIHTEDGFQRQGVAMEMLQQLQSQYPDKEIDWGMTTPDGTKLKEKATYQIKDAEVERKQKKLQSMKDEMTQNEKELNDLYEKLDNGKLTANDEKRLNELGDRWDELNVGIHEVETELDGKKAVKYMIKMPGDTKKSAGSADFEIYKADDDQHLVFGWASVAITVDGEELEDMQHDMIDPEDLEEAAYEYVLNFRDTGEEHLPGYRKKGRLVESCVFTPDKQKAMGIPAGTLPVAWWIGFKIDDEDTWRRVKDGTYRMFSIEGKAQREPIEKSAYDEWLEENMDKFSSEDEEVKFAQWKSPSGFKARSATDVDEVDMQWNEYQNLMSKKKANTIAKSFEEILEKFNPYHDRLGRFTGPGGGSGGPVTFFTNQTKDPNKQHWADMAVARMGGNPIGGGKKPGAKKPEDVDTTKPPKGTRTQTEHLDGKFMGVDGVRKITGADEQQAKEMYRATEAFTDGSYKSIREAGFKGSPPASQQAKKWADDVDRLVDEGANLTDRFTGESVCQPQLPGR